MAPRGWGMSAFCVQVLVAGSYPQMVFAAAPTLTSPPNR